MTIRTFPCPNVRYLIHTVLAARGVRSGRLHLHWAWLQEPSRLQHAEVLAQSLGLGPALGLPPRPVYLLVCGEKLRSTAVSASW